MKIAKVVPIFKAGDKSSFNNYRPISLLPQFSKIVEKLFNARLDAFIEKHDTDSESGSIPFLQFNSNSGNINSNSIPTPVQNP